MTDKDYYRLWKKLVNIPANELVWYISTDIGITSGLTAREAAQLNIRRGLDSAKAIIRMKQKPLAEWNDDDLKWMRAQVRFIKRFLGIRGEYLKGRKPTRKLRALWLWGHNPLKKSIRDTIDDGKRNTKNSQ